MKKKLYLVFTISFLNFGYCSAQNYFNKIYRLSLPDSSTRLENIIPILEVPGAGYLAAGYTNNYITKNSRLLLFNLDYQGNLLSTQSYGDSGYFYYAQSMQFTYDNNVALMVYKAKYTNPSDSIFFNLYKLNSSGNLLWSKQYSSGLIKSAPIKAIETSDHGFAVLGWTSMANNPPVKMYLIKTDSLGNTEWETQYGDSANYIYNGFSLIQESDKGYALMGIIGTNGSYYRQITLIRTDSLGNKLWQRDYGGINSYAHGEWITKLKDGNYLISGQDGVPFGNTNGLLIKTDTLGNVIFQKNYGFTQVGNIRGLVENSDGTICFNLGQLLPNPPGDVCNLYKVDQNGDSIWSRQYIYDSSVVNNYCYTYYMTSTSDGGYIICGQEKQASPATQDAWLIKVDSMGCAYPGCVPVSLSEISSFDGRKNIFLYPNPTDDFSNIILPFDLLNTRCEIVITDIAGKEVYKDYFLSSNAQNILPLQTENLLNGIYIVKVRGSGKEFSAKFFNY